MAVSHGMNPDEVEKLGTLLKEVAEHIRNIVGSLDGKVGSTTWNGPDADMFKRDWWPGHQGRLTQVANDLDGFGQSAYNNASAQRDASGV